MSFNRGKGEQRERNRSRDGTWVRIFVDYKDILNFSNNFLFVKIFQHNSNFMLNSFN